MSAASWYVAREGNRVGPYSWPQLTVMAQEGRLHPNEMVMSGDSGAWVSAHSVSGLFFKAMSANPAFPSSATAASPPISNESGERAAAWARLRETARWYFRANLTVLAAIAAQGAAYFYEAPQWATILVGVIATLGMLACLVLMAQAMRFLPWLWAVLGVVPYLNLLVLVVLADQANRYLTRRGVQVHLLGAWLPEHPSDDFVRNPNYGWSIRSL